MFRFFSRKYALIYVPLIVILLSGILYFFDIKEQKSEVAGVQIKQEYWFLLQRESSIEKLYKGVPGDESKSTLIKTFKVKTGIPGERPTPLPQLVGKEYWTITAKFESHDNPETAPYFIALDVPFTEEEPYGPSPYLECDGQCNWQTPGYFGLHGVAGDPTKLSEEDPGSSGCIRHTDEDITYLYNLIDPDAKIRYYISNS